MGFNLTQIVNKTLKVTGSSEVATLLHNNTTTVIAGVTLPLSDHSHVLLKASGYFFNFEVLLSKDNISWTKVSVMDMFNGQPQDLVLVSGDYLVNTTGWKYLKCPVKYASFKLTLSATPVYGIVDAIKAVERPTFSRPSPARPEWSQTNNLYLGFVQDVHSNGAVDTVYGFAGNSVRKSVDWGATFATVYGFAGTVPPTVNFVKKLPTGKVLVGLVNNDTGFAELWLSDTSEANFAKVHTAIASGATWSMWFGQSFVENICLVAEYGPYNSAKRVYASYDYGETWAVIFTAEASTLPGVHIHDVTYDPYGAIIWITTGDGLNAQNVYWSDNSGATWNKVYTEVGSAPSQFTQILPLPNCVLFISDSAQHMGVFRWDRVPSGIYGKTVKLVPAFMLDGNYVGESAIATRGAVSYGDNAAAYFGWTEYSDVAKKHCPVVGTRNGYDFFIVWESKTIPNLAGSFVGVYSVSLSANGNLAISIQTDEGANNNHLIKLKEPIWK